MKSIRNFLRSMDIFGTTFSFRYKDKERYQTASGGIIIILFVILVLIVGIYYLIPFVNWKNYTIVYYTMNLASTEKVNLFQSESNIAVGLECDKNDNEKLSIYDLLNIKSKYTSFSKLQDGSKNKDTITYKTHKCNYDDFYNKYNDQVDFLGLSNLECMAEKNRTIQGIYTDQIFSYYEFTIEAKNDLVLNELDRFLFENDCKMQFYYTDIIIDLDNYKKPITQYMNGMFIQLNPTLYIKRNIYFMNQFFTNDDYLLFVFEDDDQAEIKALYSRYEEYSLYKGFERNKTKIEDYDKYAKIYVRADLKKTIIKRKYQKFMEFYADASSLLIAIYYILFIIFDFIDYFYAYHSLSKHLFFFKELDSEKNFDILQKKKQIQELISLIGDEKKTIDFNNSIEANAKYTNKLLNKNKKRDNIQASETEKNQPEIKIYSNSNKANAIKLKINETEEKEKKVKIKDSKILKPQKQFKTQYIYVYNDSKEVFQNNESSIRKIISKTNKLNLRSIKNIKNSSSVNTREFKSIKNTFNVFEIMITQIFKCFMCKKLSIKNEVNENANKIIYKKLDIITYIRNMLLFDIINQTILSDDKKDIINFLCRPLISVNKEQKNEFEEFYKSYDETDFDKFENDIKNLVNKSTKVEKENKLVSLSKEHLKDFVYTFSV